MVNLFIENLLPKQFNTNNIAIQKQKRELIAPFFTNVYID